MIQKFYIQFVGIFLLFLIEKTPLQGQISLTNAYFPVANDSFKTAIANINTTLATRLTPAGGNQTWDFTYLRSARNHQQFNNIYYRAIASDTAAQNRFPTGDLIRLNSDTGSQISVYNLTATKFELLGLRDFNLGTLATIQGASFRYNPPINERHAPLSFGSPAQNFVSNLSVAISSSQLPDTLLAGLPFRPDSIRFGIRIGRTDLVDAWGTLRVTGAPAPVPVLRERRYQVTETKIEAKIGFFWLDVTSVVLSLAGLPAAKDTTINYNFWSNTSRDPIAVVQTNTRDSVTQVTFRWFPLPSAVSQLGEKTAARMRVSPNPVKSGTRLTIALSDFEPNNYSFEIRDLTGRLVLKTADWFLSDKTSLETLELPRNMSSGVYLVHLVQQRAGKREQTVEKIIVE
jgi:hypothetical protein